MKHINPYKIFESNEFIDYDKYNRDQVYKSLISSTILKKVESEVKDEILEFFYTIIDDISSSDPDNTGNGWSYKILQDFYNNDRTSSCNVLTGKINNFIVQVSINLIDFNSITIISEIESIMDKINDVGYKCKYDISHRISGSNITIRKDNHSINIRFDIRVNGSDILPKIGVDISKIKG